MLSGGWLGVYESAALAKMRRYAVIQLDHTRIFLKETRREEEADPPSGRLLRLLIIAGEHDAEKRAFSLSGSMAGRRRVRQKRKEHNP